MTARLGVLAVAIAAAVPGAACGAQKAAQLHLKLVASGFNSPVFLGAPRSEPGRLYVVEQPGVIRVLVNGHLRAQPFLDIHAMVTSGDVRVYRFLSNGTIGLPGTAKPLLRVAHREFSNHDGGQLQFGPDGRLYAGTGDGGSGGDPHNHSQNLSSHLGKLLRLNVNKRGAKWQIAAYGLRNPWRFSWDRATHDLYIGDVGQDQWEEIDVRTRVQQRVLANYGWRVFEGRSRYTAGQKINSRARLVFPIAVYSHGNGNCSVTGGYVYRGKQLPAARGRYFYGDYCTGTVWTLRAVKGKLRNNRRETIRVPSLASFGEDAAGELYAVSLDGQIYQLAP